MATRLRRAEANDRDYNGPHVSVKAKHALASVVSTELTADLFQAQYV